MGALFSTNACKRKKKKKKVHQIAKSDPALYIKVMLLLCIPLPPGYSCTPPRNDGPLRVTLGRLLFAFPHVFFFPSSWLCSASSSLSLSLCLFRPCCISIMVLIIPLQKLRHARKHAYGAYRLLELQHLNKNVGWERHQLLMRARIVIGVCEAREPCTYIHATAIHFISFVISSMSL